MTEELEWKLEIRKVQNGYVLRGKFGDSDMIDEMVIEENSDDIHANDTGYGSNLTLNKQLLWEVLEYFGVYLSNHNKHNIDIQIKKNTE